MILPDRKTLRESFRRGTGEEKRVAVSIDGFHQSAVLVPLMERGSGLTLLFTKRTESVETHKGQISFPGGVTDGGDEDAVHTALREAEEEVGIPRGSVEVLGLLDDIATPVGFVITPVVGYLAEVPRFRVNAAEVAEVFEVPLSFFGEAGAGRVEFRNVNNRRYEVWHYDTGRHVIWGATAMIVRKLLKRVGMTENLT